MSHLMTVCPVSLHLGKFSTITAEDNNDGFNNLRGEGNVIFFAQQLHVPDMFTSSSNPGAKWRSKLFNASICAL